MKDKNLKRVQIYKKPEVNYKDKKQNLFLKKIVKEEIARFLFFI